MFFTSRGLVTIFPAENERVPKEKKGLFSTGQINLFHVAVHARTRKGNPGSPKQRFLMAKRSLFAPKGQFLGSKQSFRGTSLSNPKTQNKLKHSQFQKPENKAFFPLV